MTRGGQRGSSPLLLLGLAGLLLVACRIGNPTPVALTTDGGPGGDAGAFDAGTKPDGGAQPDAGTPDAGAPDAGTPDAGAPDAGTPDAGVAADAGTSRQVVWEDPFDGPAGQLPDALRWGFDIGGHGWGNGQLEFNTDRPENVSLDGQGHLVIRARKEAYQGNEYTSARILTQGLFTHQYGRIEARIRMPSGQGLWPAFWMLGANFDTIGWPQCGEIDIMEYRGQQPGVLVGTLHGPGYSGGAGITQQYTLPGGGRFDTAFHVFAVEWTSQRIVWFVDGQPYHTVTPDQVSGAWVFDQPFFILLNVAVGGSFVGSPNASTTFPQEMLVDYVRVYEVQQ